MQKADKERVIAELTERLSSADALLVADYRGLTNSQLASLRVELLKHGAKLSVVKNTLTRRAAEAAGADALLAMLEGPTAIAFVEADGNAVAVAKALSDAAKDTKILALRGGVLSGNPITGDEIERLAKLPPLEVLQAQLVGVIVAPLTQLAAVLNAPLQNLVGLINARITQLEEGGDTSEAAAADGGSSSGSRGGRGTGRRGRSRSREEAPAEEARSRGGSRPRRSWPRRMPTRPSPRRQKRPRRRNTEALPPALFEQPHARGTNRDGNGYGKGARDARQDDRARARRAEERNRGGVGRHAPPLRSRLQLLRLRVAAATRVRPRRRTRSTSFSRRPATRRSR